MERGGGLTALVSSRGEEDNSSYHGALVGEGVAVVGAVLVVGVGVAVSRLPCCRW